MLVNNLTCRKVLPFMNERPVDACQFILSHDGANLACSLRIPETLDYDKYRKDTAVQIAIAFTGGRNAELELKFTDECMPAILESIEEFMDKR